MKQTEEKGKGGRRRTHLVKVYLSDEEYEKLCRDAEMFKRDKSEYLRLLIDWIEPVAPPSVEVKAFTRELRRLGVSLNQIAARANTLGFVDDLEYRRYAAIKEDVRRARMYSEQAKFLGKYGLDTKDDLIQHALKVRAQMDVLYKERQKLIASMMRLGYDADTVKEAMRIILREN